MTTWNVACKHDASTTTITSVDWLDLRTAWSFIHSTTEPLMWPALHKSKITQQLNVMAWAVRVLIPNSLISNTRTVGACSGCYPGQAVMTMKVRPITASGWARRSGHVRQTIDICIWAWATDMKELTTRRHTTKSGASSLHKELPTPSSAMWHEQNRYIYKLMNAVHLV